MLFVVGVVDCPVLCPPPSPTEDYRLLSFAHKPKWALHLVAFGRIPSYSVYVIDCL
jgi:hypothetical protein